MMQPPLGDFSESPGAYVEIVEQPAPNANRFRYPSEGRLAGSIPGVNSTPENKTHPTIWVRNYKGRAIVDVSCVTDDVPYKPHPHNVVGRKESKKGVCQYEIGPDDMKVVFHNLGIQCIRKSNLMESLKLREINGIDPFKTGFEHRDFDLNAVRLCFQVYLEGPNVGEFKIPLQPVVSEIIRNKKSDLKILRISHRNASCKGGQEMILLCEKVERQDIEIVFFEDVSNGWRALGEFPPADVHKGSAIYFRTPPFKSVAIIEPVTVMMQLRRPSDNARSESMDFQMLPLNEEQNAKLFCDPLRSENDHKPTFLPHPVPMQVEIDWGASYSIENPQNNQSEPQASNTSNGYQQRQTSSLFPNYNYEAESPFCHWKHDNSCNNPTNSFGKIDNSSFSNEMATVNSAELDAYIDGMGSNVNTPSMSEGFSGS